MEKKEEFRPTQPAPLPYPGAPVDVHDMIMYFAQKEDTGVEGFARPVIRYQPHIMQKVIEANKKKDPIKRNWFAANVYKLTHVFAL